MYNIISYSKLLDLIRQEKQPDYIIFNSKPYSWYRTIKNKSNGEYKYTEDFNVESLHYNAINFLEQDKSNYYKPLVYTFDDIYEFKEFKESLNKLKHIIKKDN